MSYGLSNAAGRHVKNHPATHVVGTLFLTAREQIYPILDPGSAVYSRRTKAHLHETI